MGIKGQEMFRIYLCSPSSLIGTFKKKHRVARLEPLDVELRLSAVTCQNLLHTHSFNFLVEQPAMASNMKAKVNHFCVFLPISGSPSIPERLKSGSHPWTSMDMSQIVTAVTGTDRTPTPNFSDKQSTILVQLFPFFLRLFSAFARLAAQNVLNDGCCRC